MPRPAVARKEPEAPASTLIMASLVASAGPRRREALARLVEACDQIGAKKPIKLADIQAYIVKAYGKTEGPRAQSISNEKKLPVGMYHYVEARNRERQAAGRAKPLQGQRVSQRTLTERVEEIPDMDLRADMRDLVDRLAAAQQEIAHAKTVFKTLKVGVDFDAVMAGAEAVAAVPISASSFDLDPKTISAVNELAVILTDDATLVRCGLLLRDGRIIRRAGTLDMLIPADVLTGLLKLRDIIIGHQKPAAIDQGGPDAARSGS